MTFSPLTIRRLKNFRSNKRGYYSTLIFCVLFFISIFAEFIANDKPIFVFLNRKFIFQFLKKFLKPIMEVNLKQRLITKIHM